MPRRGVARSRTSPGLMIRIENLEISMVTVSRTSEENADVILQYLIDQRFVRKADSKMGTEANLR